MRDNNIIAISALEGGLTCIERYYMDSVVKLHNLINKIIRGLPDEPGEQWIFANIFIETEISNHESLIQDALQELFNTLGVGSMNNQYESFAKKLHNLLQDTIEKTEYTKIHRYAKYLAEKHIDIPTVSAAERLCAAYRR